MISSTSRPYIIGACVALTFILFSVSANSSRIIHSFFKWLDYSDKTPKSPEHRNYLSATSGTRLRPADTTSEIGRASNSTLGFERVFVIGLPERSDKRDAMILSASLTGFQVEFVDGLLGEHVSDKARPPGLDLKDGALGSWRGHMNIIRRIIENNLASAFIMEDDVDWDIRLLNQLPEYARGIRTLSHIPSTQRQHSPYGDNWDILWPGHCGDVLPSTLTKDPSAPTKDDLYIIKEDETVAPKSAQTWLKALVAYPETHA
ncbi:hypothetical protein DID88_007953 [Monilinia fructigena]|uniref:Glycosyltransferase family 25 protein n=1 Tax=Monilinia fructigena TaxID=38457 RepID=A0A395J3S3_9HELO|nr:hypothetical protein DID88_007953 [Monilinia fructigena]